MSVPLSASSCLPHRSTIVPRLLLAIALLAARPAHAAPGVSFSVTRLDYGNQLVNIPSAAQTLTITNSGDSPLTINSISFTGTNPRDFLISSDTAQAVLAPGAARTLGIQCRPTNTGPRSAVLAVSDNSPGSPQLVSLSANGLTTFVNRSPASISFGSRQIGGRWPQRVVIRNDSNTYLAIGTVGIYGPGAAEFMLDASRCKNRALAPGASCDATVTFAPMTVGLHQATLVIVDNAPFSPHKVPLDGTGVNIIRPPVNPTGLTAQAFSSTQINLAWTDRSSDESGFELQRRLYNGTWATIATLPANSTSYADTGLAPSTLYLYRVRSFNAGGPSTYWSNEAWTETSDLPAAPTGLIAAVVSATRVNLTWTDHAGSETAFAIWRKDSAGIWTRIALVSPNTTAYSDTTVAGSHTYTYRVRAINNTGASAWTNEATVTTP